MALIFPAIAIFILPAHADGAVIARAIDGFVRPAYGHFHQYAVTLESDMEDLCAEPGDVNFDAARSDFRAVVEAWSEVETIRFGPVTEENRLERILFWPDRKSIGLKQVQAAIAARDATASDPETLKGKSVAMQGLGALEFVLFGTGAETLLGAGGDYRCAYGRAIAANLQTIARAISDDWQRPDGIAGQWTSPGPSNPLYRTDAEAMTELFNVFVHGLEMVRDVRINGFLGETADQDKPKQALFWRSQGTVAAIAHDLAGLRKLFDAAGFDKLLTPDAAWIPGSIGFEFANAGQALSRSEDVIADVLADREARENLVYARLVTSSLSELFGTRLADALGLTAGFSSLDGD